MVKASLSSWRAWIEISDCVFDCAWGSGRSPHGERGLKYGHPHRHDDAGQSLSSWRAWIEISEDKAIIHQAKVALLMESVD